MQRWLLKSDPATYGFDDLVREGRTLWEGVANPVAVKHLAAMRKGDLLVVYHTGKERAAVGLATVSAPATPPAGLVEVAVGERLSNPVTLDEIKADAGFASSPLVTMGRLSVVPLTEAQYRFLTRG